MSDTLRIEITDDAIAVMTLNRPPVNALTPEFLARIETRLEALKSDKAVRALVIVSALKVFSAGLDLKEAVDYSASRQTEITDGLNSCFAALYGYPKPVIAAVSGAAIAGGLFFVLSADMALAARGVKLGLSEVRVGVRFPVGPLEIARHALTPPAFRRILLGGLPVAADEALAMGFVDEVLDPDRLLDRAMRIARDYAAIPPETYASVKLQMRAPALSIIQDTVTNHADPVRDGWYGEETWPTMKAILAPAAK